MKKMILIPLIMIFFITLAVDCNAYEGSLSFKVDGKDITLNESTGIPYLTDSGRTMMPLRACLNAIGCEVKWNQETQTVITQKGETTVEMPVGKKEMRINQKLIAIDTAAVLKDGRTYLPLRVVMETYGYSVDWDGERGAVIANKFNNSTGGFDKLTPYSINGGTTGIFSRKQLMFQGFDGVQADITLPKVTIAEKGDCPYVYFGFDWKNDTGNVEGGFQFIEDSNHPNYNKWTVFMRQGNDWRWGNNIALEQGSTHHIKFYGEKMSENQVDLVISLDGKEIIRKPSSVADFRNTSVKAVTSMAMSKVFDGTNCLSRLENSKIANLEVSLLNSEEYIKFNDYPLYDEWKLNVGAYGTWFGTVDCIPSYLHITEEGGLSIYKRN